MAEEYAAEEGRADTAASSAAREFPGNRLSNVYRAVNRDGVRRGAVVGEGDAVREGEVGCVEGGCFSLSTAWTGRPVLVQVSSGPRTPPPVQEVRVRTADRSFPSRTMVLKRRAADSSSGRQWEEPALVSASEQVSSTGAS